MTFDLLKEKIINSISRLEWLLDHADNTTVWRETIETEIDLLISLLEKLKDQT
jgi:hypothetical protein